MKSKLKDGRKKILDLTPDLILCSPQDLLVVYFFNLVQIWQLQFKNCCFIIFQMWHPLCDLIEKNPNFSLVFFLVFLPRILQGPPGPMNSDAPHASGVCGRVLSKCIQHALVEMEEYFHAFIFSSMFFTKLTHSVRCCCQNAYG